MKLFSVFKLRVFLTIFAFVLITLLCNCSGNNCYKLLKNKDFVYYCYDSLEQLDRGGVVVFGSRAYNNIISKMDTSNIKYLFFRNQKFIGDYTDEDIITPLDSLQYSFLDTLLIINNYVSTNICSNFIYTTKTISDTLDVNLIYVYDAVVQCYGDSLICSFTSSCPPDIVKSQLKINLNGYNKIKHVIFRVAKVKRALIGL